MRDRDVVTIRGLTPSGQFGVDGRPAPPRRVLGFEDQAYRVNLQSVWSFVSRVLAVHHRRQRRGLCHFITLQIPIRNDLLFCHQARGVQAQPRDELMHG
jgi:hypothetical protein